MTYEFEYLMHLLGYSAQGKDIQTPRQAIDWNFLFRLANEQTALPLLAYALKKAPDIACPAELKDQAISDMRSAAISNCIRVNGVMKLLGVFKKAGIHAVVLKGFSVAKEYQAPECRISGDADIWVKPADENRACEVIKRQGFKVESRWENGHHAVCHHPQLGCVELHVILYDEIVEDVWFNKTDGDEFVREPHEKVITPDGEYYTLGKTDNMIFLTLHMIKHFVISGISLKMMLDVALFMKNHVHEVDFQRFWVTMRDLEFDVCVSTILWAMVHYGGFHEDDFPGIAATEPQKIFLLLDDLESGGWLGMKDKENREDGWHAYNRERLLENRSEAGYRAYMIKWQHASYWNALFPSRELMAKRYRYVIDKPWLIFYAWIYRLIFLGMAYLKSGHMGSRIVKDEGILAARGKERLERFRKLGML